jgi:uroporphyrinogen III methyltransferase/synthase
MDFVSELENYGARVLICPTIEIKELENYERLDEALNHLYGYDWIIFTSTNGVEFFLRRFKSGGFELGSLDELRVCAIGEATEAKLRDEHVHVDVLPRDFKAEGVFAAIEQFVGGREALDGLNFSPPSRGLRKGLPAARTCGSWRPRRCRACLPNSHA